MQTITVAENIKVPSNDRVDSGGMLIRGTAPEAPECGYWDAILLDGLPVDPDIAVSMQVRGEASYDVANIDADFARLAEFQRVARTSDFGRYDSVLTVASKLEVARLRAEIAVLPTFSFADRERFDAADLARAFRVDELTLRTRLAGQKFAAPLFDEAGDRWLIDAWSVRRCLTGNVAVTDPLPHRKSARPDRTAA